MSIDKKRSNPFKYNPDSLKSVIVEYKRQFVQALVNDKGVVGRYCNSSKKFLPIEFFGLKRNKLKNGSYSYCLSGFSEEVRGKLRRDILIDQPSKRLYTSTKSRARELNLDFNLTEEDLKIPNYCPILGIEIDSRTNDGHNRRMNSPSVDRLDPTKGYTKDNVIVCSWRANCLKWDGSFEEIENLYFFLKKNMNKV